MSANTKIEWTDVTWSPLRVRVRPDAAAIAESKGYASLVQIAAKMAGHVGPHCEHVSPGCELCYSGTNNGRCLPSNGTGLPFDRRSRDLVEPFVDERILLQPLRWKKPRRVFVENQSDLFGDWNPDQMIDCVFAVMELCPHITFQVLTKRAKRMREYMTGTFGNRSLANVWLGVSAEDQQRADERIPHLLHTPAAIRFVSYEPALGDVDFRGYLTGGLLDWIIVGGESGAGARPFYIHWALQLVKDCAAAGVALFMKQVGRLPNGHGFPAGFDYRKRDRKGGNMDEWPPQIRVRQFPQEVNQWTPNSLDQMPTERPIQ